MINAKEKRSQVAAQSNSITVSTPSKKEILLLKILILSGLISVVVFFFWFLNEDRIGYLPLYVLLAISLSYKILRVLHEWYHYWAMKVSPQPPSTRQWTVDMLTTAMPDEPFEMIKRTLVAMKEVRYPHTTYLCDEGNDPALIALCSELDVIHVSRITKENAKAGNINNALKQATGELCVIMDPDHIPLPSYLDNVVSYFEDTEIGYVQMVQAYYNANDNFFAKGAAQQTYLFYGPMMMGMNGHGTVQAIGANCTFRRAALDSIGGHAPGLSEDMHTAMQLHANGWKSVYTPKILTRGLVPNTLSSYCKQQLKWSRGTSDLFVHVYPKLFKNFTWRQKLHYFLLPLHYAFGFIVLLDMGIPVASLITGKVPIYIEWYQFLFVMLPYVGLTTLIRQYVQRWLLEDHEKGFHLKGGILLFGSWWIYSLGVLYTALNIKVPYIATPKDDESRNNWFLSLPNIVVCGINIVALIYGLLRDWSPYSWMMGCYVLLNIILLAIFILAAQPVLLNHFKQWLRPFSFLFLLYTWIGVLQKVVFPNTYRLLRTSAPIIGGIIFLSCNSFILLDYDPDKNVEDLISTKFKETGGFYAGVSFGVEQDASYLSSMNTFQKELGAIMNVVPVNQPWSSRNLADFPQTLLDTLLRKGVIPVITWDPQVAASSKRDNVENHDVFETIINGSSDEYIKAYALKIRNLNQPVFILFAPNADKPSKLSAKIKIRKPQEFKEAYRHIVEVFRASGVNNVSWVWKPFDSRNVSFYYPGENYVDWIGITCLNFGNAIENGKWQTFEKLYQPFRSQILELNKPVMLTEFGSTHIGGNSEDWFKSSLPQIHDTYREIRSIIFYNSRYDYDPQTKGQAVNYLKSFDWTIKKPSDLAYSFKTLAKETFIWQQPIHEQKALNLGLSRITENQKHTFLKGRQGSYQLLVKGQPFYIKGVTYNPEHDWRDGHHPLTRNQLEKDFASIKSMGANTIRRYNPGVYDHNILTIAQENELKVLYGFWFDPKVDYYRDTLKVQEYLHSVEETVRKYKDNPAILAWSVGNETSGLLKKNYSQPYLTLNRNAYMQMIELMAKRIKKLDPNHAIISSLEHAWELPGELVSFDQLVPSVDVIGINSYYIEQIGALQNIVKTYNPRRPYLISEFGPSGYWNSDYTRTNSNGLILEESDAQKASLYTQEWQNYIKKNKGYNIGGVAFCWRDRFEGSATWFGITDFKDRKKPVYYALQKIWTNKAVIPKTKIWVVGPSGKLIPNTRFVFTAVTKNNVYNKIEWKLYKDDYLEKMDIIEKTDKQNKIAITLPDTPDKNRNYRLYAYLYDAQGNVVTANMPILLKD